MSAADLIALAERVPIYLVWGVKGEYSNRTEWPVAAYRTKAEAKAAVMALKEAARELYNEYRRREDELEEADDWDGETLLATADAGRRFVALHDQEQLKLTPGSYGFEDIEFTCCEVELRAHAAQEGEA